MTLQLLADSNIALSGLEAIDGANVVEATTGHKAAGRGVCTGHHPAGTQRDSMNLHGHNERRDTSKDVTQMVMFHQVGKPAINRAYIGMSINCMKSPQQLLTEATTLPCQVPHAHKLLAAAPMTLSAQHSILPMEFIGRLSIDH